MADVTFTPSTNPHVAYLQTFRPLFSWLLLEVTNAHPAYLGQGLFACLSLGLRPSQPIRVMSSTTI